MEQSKIIDTLESYQLLLLLCILEGSRKVDDLFFFSVLGDGEGGRRWRALLVEVVLHLCTSNLREHDGLPEQEVAPRKLLLWWRPEGGGVGGGGR